jgi:hypothetical protein
VSAVIVVPWRYDPERAPLWAFVSRHLRERYPEFPIIQATCEDGPFNRSECIVRGALKTDAEVLIVHDADVVLNDDLRRSVERVRRSHGWSVPHWHLHRLTAEATAEVLSGAPLWAGMPTAQKPYKGNPTGTLVVINRELALAVPPDVRFRGWGQEDEAWWCALDRIAGKCHRGSADLFHLWHPPAERLNRRFGNADGQALLRRYERAYRSSKIMQQIVDESINLWRPEWNVLADAETPPLSPSEPFYPDTTGERTDDSSPS